MGASQACQRGDPGPGSRPDRFARPAPSRYRQELGRPGSFGHIVPGTGTGGFSGWSGSARIVHDDRGPYFEIDLT